MLSGVLKSSFSKTRNAKGHYAFSTPGFAQSWAWLATSLLHSRNPQQASGSCKAGGEGRLRWFLPLIQDLRHSTARSTPSLIGVLFWHCFQMKVTSQTQATKCKKISQAESNMISADLTKACCCADGSGSPAQLRHAARFHHESHSLYPTPSIYSFTIKLLQDEPWQQGICHKANTTKKKKEYLFKKKLSLAAFFNLAEVPRQCKQMGLAFHSL